MTKKTYDCGLAAALDVIGGKWKVLILWVLSQKARRFGELRKEVTGISEKILIQQLKELEQDAVISRKDYKEVPPRVEYSLTPFGESLGDALGPLCEWGEAHMKRIGTRKARCDMNAAKKAGIRSKKA